MDTIDDLRNAVTKLLAAIDDKSFPAITHDERYGICMSAAYLEAIEDLRAAAADSLLAPNVHLDHGHYCPACFPAPTQQAELEAARAVVGAAEKRRAAQAACDAEAERPAPSRSSAPMVRLIGCDRRLYEALDAYAAAKAGKAVE